MKALCNYLEGSMSRGLDLRTAVLPRYLCIIHGCATGSGAVEIGGGLTMGWINTTGIAHWRRNLSWVKTIVSKH